MNKVDIIVPLSGYQIFDISTYLTARHLCIQFPCLNYIWDTNKKEIKIYGKLNNFCYSQFNKVVF